ncbi:MAG: hypothetical protein AAF368_09255 [Planctomycetota bacterium]
MLWRAAPALLLLFLSPACGEEETQESLLGKARTALSQSDWELAAEYADAALNLVGADSDSYFRYEAQIAFVEAGAYVTPELAQNRLHGLVLSSEVLIDDFVHLTMSFVKASEHKRAFEIVQAARLKRLFGAALLDKLDVQIRGYDLEALMRDYPGLLCTQEDM